MIAGIMQPYFFPYIGYFQLIDAVDKFVVFDDVNYIKKGWINRNRVIVNGSEFLLTLPIEKLSQNKLIKDIYIFEPAQSKNKILQTIEHCYKKAPNFNNAFTIVEELVLSPENNLSDYLQTIIKGMCKHLEIATPFIKSSDINKINELKGQHKIIDICKTINADVYINAIGGKSIYDEVEFANEGIKLLFIQTKNIKYEQYNNEVIPNLSIIDVLMFNEISEIKNMLKKYDLVKKN